MSNSRRIEVYPSGTRNPGGDRLIEVPGVGPKRYSDLSEADWAALERERGLRD